MSEGERRSRGMWSGTISFGLVSVPVELFPASRPAGASLRMLAADGTPLERRYWCERDDKLLESDEIVRGYEVAEGEYVIVTDEELEAIEPRKSRDIDLREFVARDALDSRWFRRGYFLIPGGDSDKAYRLLARAMESTGRAGIATFVMRGHEYLVAILADNGILRAELLRFHDELRTPEQVGLPENPEVDDKTARALQRQIESHAVDDFAPEELEDEHTARLEELVEAKRRRGKDVFEAPTGEGEGPGMAKVIDLMEVLKRSLAAGRGEAAGSSGAGRRTKGSRRGSRGELGALTKAQLYARARRLDIAGRSKMSKDELIASIERAGAGERAAAS